MRPLCIQWLRSKNNHLNNYSDISTFIKHLSFSVVILIWCTQIKTSRQYSRPITKKQPNIMDTINQVTKKGWIWGFYLGARFGKKDQEWPPLAQENIYLPTYWRFRFLQFEVGSTPDSLTYMKKGFESPVKVNPKPRDKTTGIVKDKSTISFSVLRNLCWLN